MFFIEDGPPAIKSENARLNGWTFIDIEGVDVGTYVEKAKVIVAAELQLPAGYSISWAGQYEYMERAKAKLSYVVPLTLGIILILLYMNFRRFAEVAIIMGTLPFSLVGAIWLMYLLDFNFSVAAGVGFIALAGVATELSVIMLVFLEITYQQMRKRVAAAGRAMTRGDLIESILEGGALRVRPKAMTAAAIIAGLLPIMYGNGTGSEVMSRIAAPMVGGMVSAVILTLLVVPAVYYLWRTRSLKA